MSNADFGGLRPIRKSPVFSSTPWGFVIAPVIIIIDPIALHYPSGMWPQYSRGGVGDLTTDVEEVVVALHFLGECTPNAALISSVVKNHY